jgi:aryl-phospho-beta-D-glucosidase BglC (GH1 family)
MQKGLIVGAGGGDVDERPHSDRVRQTRRAFQLRFVGHCGRVDPRYVNAASWSTLLTRDRVAHTDCAKYLNGRGSGARFDGSLSGSTRVGSCTGLTGKASSFSSSYKTFLRQFWEAQVISYEKGQGWIQWY